MADPCVSCPIEKKDRSLRIPCSLYPCAQVMASEAESRAKVTRRGIQRLTSNDFQMLAKADPAELAGAGAFD